MNIDSKRLSKLNSKQLKIVEKREKEKDKRLLLINKLNVPKPDVQQFLFDYLKDLVEDMCEHGRSMDSSCFACVEIEQLLYPDMFEDGYPIDGLPEDFKYIQYDIGDRVWFDKNNKVIKISTHDGLRFNYE